ncbi:MAG: hypothetical protein VKK80_08140 [Prochlorothrix sp.]|nr:hypothetical protein [Prochlorothrix sp.]
MFKQSFYDRESRSGWKILGWPLVARGSGPIDWPKGDGRELDPEVLSRSPA